MVVDFSSKHDIWIHHKDGNYTPMDEPYYEVKQLDETTWQIMSSGDYHYLLVGDDEGIAIDTGYGAGNLREFLERLCNKPVRRVINTHHHFDHSANNCYFDKAYMAEEAISLVSVPYSSFAGMDFYKDCYEKAVVRDKEMIPLAGRDLQVFRIGDHTSDGIAILDRRNRYLFTGDEFMPGGKDLNQTVSKWHHDLEKLAAHRSEFDELCGGPCILSADVFDTFLEACEEIQAGHESKEANGHKGGSPIEPETYEGHKVYDCQLPHIEDIPKGMHGRDLMRGRLLHKGFVFTFNRGDIV